MQWCRHMFACVCACLCWSMRGCAHVHVHVRELCVVCIHVVLLLPARASSDIWALSAAGALPRPASMSTIPQQPKLSGTIHTGLALFTSSPGVSVHHMRTSETLASSLPPLYFITAACNRNHNSQTFSLTNQVLCCNTACRTHSKTHSHLTAC